MFNSSKTQQPWTRATMVCMIIFGTSQITLSFQRQSSRFLSKSDRPHIENNETKIYPPPNLKPPIQENPTSKHNKNQTRGKLQNARMELGDPSRSKISLAATPMSSSAIMIQHLVYVNTKGVNCISSLRSFSLTNPSTLWTPNYSTTQNPPLCTNYRNI